MGPHSVDPSVIFEERRHLSDGPKRMVKPVAFIGLLMLGVSVLLSYVSGDGWSTFAQRYLVAYMWWLSIALGALFFVIIQHLTKAGWSVVVRRVAEILSCTMPVLAVLSLPLVVSVLMQDSTVFRWADPAEVAKSGLIQKKVGYLNPWFFAIRVVLYFVVLISLTRFFLKHSKEQDETGNIEHTRAMQKLSPLAIILFALTTTFISFDFLMSLDPEWFSTMFGVYFFAGCVVSFLAFYALTLMGLQRRGLLKNAVTTEHFHDIGKLNFAFIFFWGYVAFSQFMLIWYANIPEETLWFEHRSHGPWFYVAIALVACHLFIPFAGMLSRHVKRSRKGYAFWAIWLLVIHWVDLNWIITPTWAHGDHTSVFHFVDVSLFLGVGALVLATALGVASKVSLVPERDPLLGESLAFHNM